MALHLLRRVLHKLHQQPDIGFAGQMVEVHLTPDRRVRHIAATMSDGELSALFATCDFQIPDASLSQLSSEGPVAPDENLQSSLSKTAFPV